MGAFKPLLPFGKKTVVEACVETLLAGGASRVSVVAGQRATELEAVLSKFESVSVRLNLDAESEMGASIARGIEAVSDGAEAVLVALADHPAVPSSVVSELIETRRREGARLVVPTWEGRGGHPVLIDLRFREELLDLPSEGGLRAFFEARRAEVLRLPVSSPYVARDMDTPEEYRSLHAEMFGYAPAF